LDHTYSAGGGIASESTAARHGHLASRLRAAGLGALAGLGFTGLDPGPKDPVIITGCQSAQTHRLAPAQRRGLSAARAPAGHGFTGLKNWRILTRFRTGPGKATILLRALLEAAIRRSGMTWQEGSRTEP